MHFFKKAFFSLAREGAEEGINEPEGGGVKFGSQKIKM